jgi:hypothetical protein
VCTTCARSVHQDAAHRLDTERTYGE